MKYWQALLIRQKEIGKRGLTIPFIIGSKKYYNGEIDTIEELINDILNSKSQIVYYTYCATLKKLIFELYEPDKPNSFPGRFPKSKNNIQKKFKQNKHCYDDGETIEDIISKLNGYYKKHIDESRFSITEYDERFREYEESDKRFIKKAFEKLN